MRRNPGALIAILLLLCGDLAKADELICNEPEPPQLPLSIFACEEAGPYLPGPPSGWTTPREEQRERVLSVARRHRLEGEASYYSQFFDGRKTANGEIFRQARYSGAHLTLPLGSWVEIFSLATQRSIRLRINDRGPYKGGFVVDLSKSAARALGVDHHPDRRVEMTLLALPGEEPPEPAGQERIISSVER